jgi:hypothetical protein
MQRFSSTWGNKTFHFPVFFPVLINANISVSEQPELFHWAHRRWPLYTYLRHVHVLDHDHFTDIEALWRSRSLFPRSISKN